MELDAKVARKLQTKFEEAMIKVMASMGLKQLPILVGGEHLQAMAAAAVDVYRTVLRNSFDSNTHDPSA
jgi:hypothetical protein